MFYKKSTNNYFFTLFSDGKIIYKYALKMNDTVLRTTLLISQLF